MRSAFLSLAAAVMVLMATPSSAFAPALHASSFLRHGELSRPVRVRIPFANYDRERGRESARRGRITSPLAAAGEDRVRVREGSGISTAAEVGAVQDGCLGVQWRRRGTRGTLTIFPSSATGREEAGRGVRGGRGLLIFHHSLMHS
eukprot:864551-Rhodomonas_salina.1